MRTESTLTRISNEPTCFLRIQATTLAVSNLSKGPKVAVGSGSAVAI